MLLLLLVVVVYVLCVRSLLPRTRTTMRMAQSNPPVRSFARSLVGYEDGGASRRLTYHAPTARPPARREVEACAFATLCRNKHTLLPPSLPPTPKRRRAFACARGKVCGVGRVCVCVPRPAPARPITSTSRECAPRGAPFRRLPDALRIGLSPRCAAFLPCGVESPC